MFDSIPFSSLRLLALIVHFIFTTGLVWTRSDCLQVTLKPSATTSDYEAIERSYLSLIAFGIISLILEMVMLVAAPKQLSLFGAVKLFLDIVASFFIAWIILDGLEWLTYVYIFVFCVIVPTVGEIAVWSLQIYRNIWVDWRRTRTIFQHLYEGAEYVWSWVAYVGSCLLLCFCSSDPSPLYIWCVGTLAWVRAEGCAGVARSCWSCAASITTTGPSALLASCWSGLSSGCTGTWEWCSSLTSALMRGPAGLMEFCSAGISNCGAPDSLLSRLGGCLSYLWTGITGAGSYVASAFAGCWRYWAPVIQSWLVALRDFVWSWLMWVWRQIQLFCT